MTTLYEVLGIQPNASALDIRAAFKRCALALHPDKGGSKERFQQALKAFEVLSDSAGRLRYDAGCAVSSDVGHMGRRGPAEHWRRDQPPTRGRPSEGPPQWKRAAPPGGGRTTATKVPPSSHFGFCRSGGGSGLRSGPSSRGHHSGQYGSLPPRGRVPSASHTGRTGGAAASSSQGPRSPASAGAKRRDARDSACLQIDQILERVFQLLQKLTAQQRRQVLAERFTQQQRLCLERWAVDRRTRASSGPCPAAEASSDMTCGSVSATPTLTVSSWSPSAAPSPDGNFSPDDDLSGDEVEEVQEAAVWPWAVPLAICDGCVTHGPASEGEEGSLSSSDQEGTAALCADGPYGTTQLVGDPSAPTGAAARVPQQPRRAGVRGIASRLRRDKPCYQAVVCVETFYLVSRELSDLDGALDALVVLTAMKHRIGEGAKDVSDDAFAERIRAAIPEVLAEHGITADALGLGFHVMMSMRFWVRPPLHTPHVRSLDVALDAWKRLAQFRVRADEGHRSIARRNWQELKALWEGFREVYLDIMEEQGCGRIPGEARLQAIEAAAEPYRERQLERWNRQAMATEDRLCHRSRRAVNALRQPEIAARRLARMESRMLRWNQQAMAAEERRQRRFEAQERKLEMWNRRAMMLEDRRCRERRSAATEARAVLHIERLLRRWRRLQEVVARAARQQAKAAKPAAGASAGCARRRRPLPREVCRPRPVPSSPPAAKRGRPA